MAEETSDVMVKIGTQLDEKGLIALNKQLEKAGMAAKKSADTGALSFQKVGKEVEKSGKSVSDYAIKMTAAYFAVKKFWDASAGQAKADAQLKVSIANNTTEYSRQGKSVEQLTDEMKNYADQREKATNIDDIATKKLQAMVLAAGEVPENVNRVVAAMQDMESAGGPAAEGFARAWARLGEDPSEALGVLSRAGLKFDKELMASLPAYEQKNRILAEMEKRWGGTAEQVAAAAGPLAKFEVSLGDTMESIGNLLSTVLSPFINGLGKIFDWFNALGPASQVAVVGVGAISAALIAMSAAGITSFTALTAAVKAFFLSMGPVGWIITGVGAVATTLGLLGNSKSDVEQATDSLGRMNTAMKQLAENKGIDKAIDGMSNLKQGTDAYSRAVENLLKQYPQLRAYGVNAASSLDQIRRAANNANIALTNMTNQERKTAFESAQNALAKGIPEIASKFGASEEKSFELSRQAAANVALISNIMAESGQATQAQIAAVGAAYERVLRSYGAQEKYINEYRAKLAILLAGMGKAPEGKGANTAPGGDDTSKQMTQEERDKLRAAELRYLKELQIGNLRFKYARQVGEIELQYADKLDELKSKKTLTDEERKKAKENIEKGKAFALAETYIEAGTNAVNVVSMAMDKNFRGAIASALSTFSPVAATAFETAVDFLDKLFGGSAKTFASTLKEEVGAALADLDDELKETELFKKLFGTTSTTKEDLAATKEARTKLLNRLGLGNATRKEIGDFYKALDAANFSGVSTKMGTEWADILSPFQSADMEQNWGKSQERIKELFKKLYGDQADEVLKAMGLVDKFGNISKSAWYSVRGDIVGANNALKDSVNAITDMTEKMDELETKTALTDLKDNIEGINDQYELGNITYQQYYEQSLAAIDAEMAHLKTLEQTQEVQDALVELEKMKLKLKKENADMDAKALLSAEQLQALNAIDEMERGMKTGAIKKDYGNYMLLQGYYTQLLESMKLAGMYGTEAYNQIEDRMVAMVEGQLGGAGFAAVSGTGSAAVLPGVTGGRTAAAYGAAASAPSSNNQTIIINAPMNLPQEMVTWYVRAANAQSGK